MIAGSRKPAAFQQFAVMWKEHIGPRALK